MRDNGSPTRLGLRANLAQFCLLVLVNALVGGMVGQEQTVLPLLAQQDFHLTGYTFLLSYVLAFGITKAGDELPRRHLVGPLRAQTGAAGWVAHRHPGAAAADLGAVVGMGGRGQHAAGYQPGPDLVDDRRHEDRPRWTPSAGATATAP